MPGLISIRNAPGLPLPVLSLGHLPRAEIRTSHVDFALKFALDTSTLTALSKAIPQRKCRLDRESAV